MQRTNKLALITGANKGIGYEVARQIANAGWTVLAAARNAELGSRAAEKLQADHLKVKFIHLDVNAPQSAASAAATIRDQYGKLDLLVNNAGISSSGDGPPSKVGPEMLASVMRTNFIGAVTVTQALLPLLQKADKSQIINVSSELGSISQQTNSAWKYSSVKVLAYCASKAALNMFTTQLASELRSSRVTVNSVNPGYTATDLNGHSGPQTVEQGAAEIVRLALLDSFVTGKFFETGGEVPW